MEKIREYTPIRTDFSALNLDNRNEADFGIDATYRDIEYTVKQLATEKDEPGVQRTHFILCGDPGIGKTTIVEKALHSCIPADEYDNRVVKFSGKVGRGVDNVAKILRTYAEGKILLFDDCDDWLKSESIANILKAAMLESKVTIIGQNYDTKPKIKESFADIDIFKDFEKNYGYDDTPEEPSKPAKSSAVSDTGTKYDATFDFTSRFIFISNMDRQAIDSAILSRSIVIELKLNTEQTIDLLENKVAETIPVRWPAGVDEKGKHAKFCKFCRMRVLDLLKVFSQYTANDSTMPVTAVIGPIKERNFKNKINFRTYKDAVSLWANKYFQIKNSGTEPDNSKVMSRCDTIVLSSFASAVS